MSDTEELKPCPSGLSDRGHTAPIWNAGSGKWHCECACGWRANEADDVAGAYSFWNRRSPPGVETEGQIAALEKMLERASKIGSSRQLNDLIPEMRALLSTSSRGEDLSSRDKRASLPASDGRLLIAAHTKGQWFVADNDGTTGYGPHDVSAKLIRTDGGYVVAAVMTDTKDLRESTNAELLAGAPDLWDALQSIAANTCCKPCQEAALVARSALAKIGAPIGSQASE